MSSEERLSQSRVVRKLAESVCDRITRRVVTSLQRMQDLLSGDDTGLRNTWDEICVQVQGEYSYSWDAYEETVRSLVETRVEELSDFEREAIWLQTPDGQDWDFDAEEPDSNPVVTEDIVEYLMSQYIFAKAADWSKVRIRQYLDGDYSYD